MTRSMPVGVDERVANVAVSGFGAGWRSSVGAWTGEVSPALASKTSGAIASAHACSNMFDVAVLKVQSCVLSTQKHVVGQ